MLVRGNTIERIAPAGSIPPGAEAGATVIPGGGRVLMPGLIDAHWHTMLLALPADVAIFADIGFLNLVAGVNAEATLMRGFTTVRDMGGAGLRPQARDRLRHRGGTAHLPVGGHDYPDRGTRRFPVPLRAPAREHEPAVPHGGPGFVLHRRRRSRGAAPGARAARAGRLPDQARGGGRRLLSGPRGDHRLLRRRAPGAVEAARNWGTYVNVHAYIHGHRCSRRSPPASRSSTTAT